MTTHQACLFDAGQSLKERAREAVRTRNAMSKGARDRVYQDGRVMAFNEAISILQQTAKGLGLPLADLRLHDIAPDRELT